MASPSAFSRTVDKQQLACHRFHHIRERDRRSNTSYANNRDLHTLLKKGSRYPIRFDKARRNLG